MKTLLDTVVPHFPPLPHDSYSPRPTQQATVTIPPLTLTKFELDNALPLAWALVLSSRTNSPDVVYGTAAGSAQQPFLPFRWKINPSETVQAALAGIAAHRARLHDANVQNPVDALNSRFRNVLSIGPDLPCGDDFALLVHCRVEDNSVQITATFDPVVVSEWETKTILLQLSDTVRMVYSTPGETVDGLQQLGPGGLEQVRRFNLKKPNEEEDECIHEMIEQRLKDSPSANAVCAWDGTLTYSELDRVSLQVAAQLAVEGIRPGAFVGIFMPKCLSAIVTMVAIIRGGGGFIFLPPTLPIFRLKVMCEKTPVSLVATVESLLDDASQLGPKVKVLSHHKDSSPGTWSPPTITATDPLYSIYTSGSTGEPKCLIIDRSSYGPGVRQFIDALGISPEQRVLQSVSYAFIVSIIEQLTALATGACICVPSEEQLQNDLEGAICEKKATWAIITPSVARTLDAGSLPLETLVLAGEPVSQSDMDQWKGHVQLFSLYGQSETASTLLIEDVPQSGSDRCGLGTITSGACWIVDPNNHARLAPFGAEGELMIESRALARCYRNNPEGNAKTFIETPEWLTRLRREGMQNRRCLLTGDIVRYIDIDGTIRFVGRRGTAAKIRGQRVEVGEVECHLRPLFPGANVAVETVQPAASSQGQTVLVGFVAGWTGDICTDAPRAIADLRRVLPSFMVPSTIVSLGAMPKTATGKIYRKGLREMVSELTLQEILAYNQDAKAYQAPVTRAEELIQRMVAEILRLSQSSVSLDRSFFEIGGDSLTTRQLVAKARQHGLCITVVDVFEAPKLSELALRLSSTSSNRKHDDPFQTLKQDLLQNVPAFLRGSIEDVYPTQDLGTQTVNERRVDYFPFVLQGNLDRARFAKACEAVIHSIPVLRSIFLPSEKGYSQVTLRAISTPYQELAVPEDEDVVAWTSTFITGDKKTQLSFEQPVIKFCLLRKNPKEHVFILRIPHALYDGACLEQLGKSLSAAYNNMAMETVSTFGDYARAVARLRTQDALDYWQGVIAGAEITRLPHVLGEKQAMAMYSGECVPRSPPPGFTMSTAIKAAWAWVLHRHTKRADVLFGQVGSTRDIDLEGASDMIGFCLNTTAVRVRFDETEGMTVDDLLRAIQQQHVLGLRYQTVDWSEVVEHGAAWPQNTILDSAVLHENFGSLPTLNLEGVAAQLMEPVFDLPQLDQHLLCTFPGDGVLTVFLLTGSLEKVYAEGLVGMFTRTLTRFLDFPEGLLDEL